MAAASQDANVALLKAGLRGTCSALDYCLSTVTQEKHLPGHVQVSANRGEEPCRGDGIADAKGHQAGTNGAWQWHLYLTKPKTKQRGSQETVEPVRRLRRVLLLLSHEPRGHLQAESLSPKLNLRFTTSTWNPRLGL